MYVKQNLKDGDILTAKHIDYIEQGIQDTQKMLLNAKAKIGSVALLANNWVGNTSPFSQVVEVEGTTKNSQVDLTPSVEQLSIFYQKDLAFVTENDGGVITVYAIGQKPTNDYTIQVTITEVEV